MRGTYVGHVLAVYRRKEFTKRYQSGGSALIPETTFLLLGQGFDTPPVRVRLSEAQAQELGNPALQFEMIQVQGAVVRDDGGFGQVIEAATYAPVPQAASSK